MSSDLESAGDGEWASWPAIRSGGAAGAAPFRSLRLGIAVTVGRALWVGIDRYDSVMESCMGGVDH